MMAMTPEQQEEYRKERFARAWKDAQVLMKMPDLELAVLLAQMASQVEVHAEMASDDAYDTNELTPEGAFDMATDYIGDIYSRENLKFYFNNFAEEMKAFGTKRIISYEPKLPG